MTKHIRVGAAVVIMAVFVSGGCILNVASRDPVDDTAYSRLRPTSGMLIAPIALSGTGNLTTPEMVLAAGQTHVSYAHHGQGDFVVRLLDARGQLVQVVANGAGPLTGEAAFTADYPEVITIQIEAGGLWDIAVKQE